MDNNNHYSLTDIDFEKHFAEGSLDPALFTHEAHLRLAWIHITKYGVYKAIDNISIQIRNFATLHGDGKKFHMTVTVASVRTVHHFIQKSKSTNFRDFLKEFPQLNDRFRELLGSHYSDEIFQSNAARERYIEPDREPFDRYLAMSNIHWSAVFGR